MLLSLDIRDMLIIDHLELEFQPGLNVLTGETGAGKSILLDALGFVLGWRGRAELVRAGAARGEVTAVFDIAGDHPAQAVLAAADLPGGDELILRRTNTPDGRKSARINDRRASAEVLRALSDCLVELHGQQDDRGLLNPASHRAILDDFGGLGGDLAAVRNAWRHLGGARAALEQAQTALAAAREEEDFLRHAAGELDALAPEPGEEATLDARRRLMQAAEKIGEDIAKAHGALGGSGAGSVAGAGAGAEAQMIDALRWLEAVAAPAEGRLDMAIAALGRALTELGEAQQGVEDCQRDLAHDPHQLELAEERLFAIRALARKHAVQPDDLAEFGRGLHERISALERGDADLRALQGALEAAQLAYDDVATRLGDRRRAAAKRLDRAMAGELAPLKLERARFSTEITETDPGPQGRDRVAFAVSTNPGAPAGPLNRIASGGELSRFLLALKVCLTGGARPVTMIFDEIDRGIGGATADAVGRRLAQIAQSTQVLVVTHSPQVAARAGHHWRVEKSVSAGETLSRVVALDEVARIDEVARMLAGDTITDEARAAARVLLAG
jgi:DNA repair protein RecN (Recombination protein N)